MNKKIKRLIDKSDVVSFDMFDTLIKRDVSEPQNVYRILQNEIHEANFFEKRFNAEKRLWKQEEKFNIYNIYKLLKYSNKKIEELIDKEFKLECMLSRKNNAMIEIYDYCLKKKKIIVITTDTFWKEKHVKELLDRNNIHGYNSLFVSSEFCATKNSGRLFEIVKQKYSNKKILHIGDSKKSDFIMPRLKGIKGYKIPRSMNYLSYMNKKYIKEKRKTIGDDILVSSINNTVAAISDESVRIGYEILGPLLLGYLTWLKKKSEELKIDKIIFLARDGFIMDEAFNYLCNKKIDFSYFYVSRASMTSVLLHDIESFEDVVKVINFRRREKISEVLKDVGIEEMKDEDASYADIEISRDELNKNNKYLSILNKYIPQIRDMSLKSSDAFRKYLDLELRNRKKILVADVGWHGTIQNYLTTFSKKKNMEFNFYGCYIGLDYRNLDNQKKYSYAFGKNSSQFRPDQVFGYRGVMETFFSANHGTTLAYKETVDTVVPVLEKYNQDSYTQKFIHSVHEGALSYINDFQERYGELSLDFSPEISFGSAYNLMTWPKKSDLEIVRNISFSDRDNLKLIPKTKKYYLLHFIRMVNDFENSDWKFGFMKFIFPVFNLSGLLTKIYRIGSKK